jgi:hypothetical protein
VEVDEKGFERWLDIEFMVGSPGDESQYVITDRPALLPERVVIGLRLTYFRYLFIQFSAAFISRMDDLTFLLTILTDNSFRKVK